MPLGLFAACANIHYTPSGQYLALYAFGAVLGLAVLIAAAFTARLAAGPLSVAFLGPRLQEDMVRASITPMTLRL